MNNMHHAAQAKLFPKDWTSSDVAFHPHLESLRQLVMRCVNDPDSMPPHITEPVYTIHREIEAFLESINVTMRDLHESLSCLDDEDDLITYAHVCKRVNAELKDLHDAIKREIGNH